MLNRSPIQHLNASIRLIENRSSGPSSFDGLAASPPRLRAEGPKV